MEAFSRISDGAEEVMRRRETVAKFEGVEVTKTYSEGGISEAERDLGAGAESSLAGTRRIVKRDACAGSSNNWIYIAHLYVVRILSGRLRLALSPQKHLDSDPTSHRFTRPFALASYHFFVKTVFNKDHCSQKTIPRNGPLYYHVAEAFGNLACWPLHR